jgi:hypothetical protein
LDGLEAHLQLSIQRHGKGNATEAGEHHTP